MRAGLPIPSDEAGNPRGALEQFRVNQENQLEVLYAPLYDTLTYAQAGQTSSQFFAVPNGSGGKTLADTNMTLAAQLPSPQAFLVTAISLDLFPAALPGRVAAAKAGVLASNMNDVYKVMAGSAYLQAIVGTKPQITEGRLGKFCSSWRLHGVEALAMAGEVADSVAITDYASTCGEPYNVVPFVIPSTQNFSVTCYFPTVITVTAACPFQATLHGYLYRGVQ
jgi:hypothetical protein